MSDQLVEKLLEIAQKRREILEQMRQALRAGDTESVVRLAAKLTGMADEECHRTNPRIN
ncbi:MAG TPA: hypothetical protein VHX36_12550 [Candidatus Acidoferrales bacterium]|nr:hypothetical protein [Candidatus Acidoferrales bacterium]